MPIIKKSGWTFNSDLPAFARALAEGCSIVVDETAELVLADAQAAAPVDKSALQKSGAVRSARRDETANASAAARAANPGAEIDKSVLGVRENWEEEDVAVAEVLFLVAYAGFVHNGFYSIRVNRHIAGRPFLAHSMRNRKDEFEGKTAKMLSGLGLKVTK